MFKSITLSIAIASFSAMAANAQDTVVAAIEPTTEIVETETETPANDNLATLIASFEAVCAAASDQKLILSPKAATNCETMTPPAAYKNGKQFLAAKNGAEFNTLINNLSIFNG